MSRDSGRVGKPTGLSSATEPASSLGPSGFDPSRITEAVKRLGAGGKRAILRMTEDWQFCGKGTFDANGAHNAWWRTKGGVERELQKDGKWSRDAYRLSPFGVAIQAHLRDSDGSPEGRDATRLGAEPDSAGRSGSEGIAQTASEPNP